jgi:hypothetical protein
MRGTGLVRLLDSVTSRRTQEALNFLSHFFDSDSGRTALRLIDYFAADHRKQDMGV